MHAPKLRKQQKEMHMLVATSNMENYNPLSTF